MKILITGGAGFIGSAVIRELIRTTTDEVVNVDALTYAGSLTTVASVADNPRYRFEHANICDAAKMKAIFEQHRPDAVMHLAAESHVDRSIDGPAAFITTNVVGTYTMLDTARAYWLALEPERRERFRFHHISTDEVFGSLGPDGKFVETTPYDPSSPYSASKAGSDHLVRAWGRTFGLPILVTNCSNNYGPYQFPEKLIPLMITSGVAGRRLPVYGAGTNVRDWLYVEDHARALIAVVKSGRPDETYNIGGDSERQNIEVVRTICSLLNERLPDSPYKPFEQLIQHVTDRPGHDHRYAIDASKIKRELGWRPERTFEAGLKATVEWYLENGPWLNELEAQKKYHGERLGLQTKKV